MNTKFTKKSYLTTFTGVAPTWDAEIGCYNINALSLLFLPLNRLAGIKVRSNTQTKEKIVIFELENKTIILQPKDFIVVEGGIAVKDNDYMKNKLQGLAFLKCGCLKFVKTGFQMVWDLEDEEKEEILNSIGGNN